MGRKGGKKGGNSATLERDTIALYLACSMVVKDGIPGIPHDLESVSAMVEAMRDMAGVLSPFMHAGTVEKGE